MNELIKLVQQVETDVLQLETALIIALLLITAIALVVNRLRFPFTVALVFAGRAHERGLHADQDLMPYFGRRYVAQKAVR